GEAKRSLQIVYLCLEWLAGLWPKWHRRASGSIRVTVRLDFRWVMLGKTQPPVRTMIRQPEQPKGTPPRSDAERSNPTLWYAGLPVMIFGIVMAAMFSVRQFKESGTGHTRWRQPGDAERSVLLATWSAT